MPRHPATPVASDEARPGDAGATLVEVVVAALLLGMLAAVGTTAVLAGQSVTVANRSRVVAAGLAAREIDYARQQLAADPGAAADLVGEGTRTNVHPLDPATPAGADDALVVDGMRYTVARVAEDRWLGETSACLGGPATGAAPISATAVAVTVTWESMGSAAPYTLEQLFAPHRDREPAQERARVVVRVVDDLGEPAADVQARVQRIDGTQAQTVTTDGSGCAVAAVSPDAAGSDYQVTLGSTAPVRVAPDGAREPTTTVYAVAPGGIARTSFTYAVAGVLEVDTVGGHEYETLLVVAPDGTSTVYERGSRYALITVPDCYPGVWRMRREYGTVLESVVVPAGGRVKHLVWFE